MNELAKTGRVENAVRPLVGFKCPHCKECFGIDKDAFTRHLKTSGECAATAAVFLTKTNAVIDIL